MKFLSKIQKTLEDKSETGMYRWRYAAVLIEAWLREQEIDQIHRLCPVWEIR